MVSLDFDINSLPTSSKLLIVHVCNLHSLPWKVLLNFDYADSNVIQNWSFRNFYIALNFPFSSLIQTRQEVNGRLTKRCQRDSRYIILNKCSLFPLGAHLLRNSWQSTCWWELENQWSLSHFICLCSMFGLFWSLVKTGTCNS